MNKHTGRLLIIAASLLLFVLACNFPIIDQIQSILPFSRTGSSGPPNTDGAELTFIPGATFLMGSSQEDLLADQDEFPSHEVTVVGFYIYTHEVSNQMYSACVEAASCLGIDSLEAGPTSHFQDPEFNDHPVVGADWVMARDYCAWAGGRLPTEAEWELASRGPDSLIYPWGEEPPSCDLVNMFGCIVPPDTNEAGSYLKGNSPEGVWDMSGNAWEWVHDWYAEDYYAQSPVDNPIGPYGPADPEQPLRVVRGGGLYSEPHQMRSAARLGINPYRPFDDVGFRCVAEGALALPDGYDPGDNRHERVPPGSADGGDQAEDPADGRPWIDLGEIRSTCPGPRVQISVELEASSPIIQIEAYNRGALWDRCIYEEARHIANCLGTTPARDYFTIPPATFPMDFCVTTEEMELCYTDVPVRKPTECVSLILDTYCISDGDVQIPAVSVDTRGVFAAPESITVEGTDLSCRTLLGFYECVGFSGDPGEEMTLSANFEEGFSVSGMITVPPCGAAEDGYLYARFHCPEIDGVITPALILNTRSSAGVFEGATANGTPLSCELLPGRTDNYLCTGLPGSSGDTLTIMVSYSPDGAREARVVFLDCEGGITEIPPPWELVEVGCQSEIEYYAVIDTIREETITAHRLEGVLDHWLCEEQDTHVGRWYCNFPVADHYTSLTFCAEWAGRTTEFCSTFPDFGSRLPDTCAEPVDVPDDEGEDECSQWTNFNECVANGCTWDGSACHE